MTPVSPPEREQPDEAHGAEHRRIELDRAFVHGRGPVKDLDRRRHCDQKAQQRKDHAAVDADPRHEHVMGPDQEADERDRQACEGDKVIAKHTLAREAGDHFTDDAHARQHHDVDGRVRVEPEHVLEQHRVAAQGRVKDSHAKDALNAHQQQRDREHRRGKHHDDARRIMAPAKQRQAEPGHPRAAHLVNRHDEIQAREDGAESVDEDCHHRQHHMRVGKR